MIASSRDLGGRWRFKKFALFISFLGSSLLCAFTLITVGNQLPILLGISLPSL